MAVFYTAPTHTDCYIIWYLVIYKQILFPLQWGFLGNMIRQGCLGTCLFAVTYHAIIITTLKRNITYWNELEALL